MHDRLIMNKTYCMPAAYQYSIAKITQDQITQIEYSFT